MNNLISKRLNKQNMDRAISYFKRNGLKDTYYKAVERLSRDNSEQNYQEEAMKAFASEEELKAQREVHYTHSYKFSILVPTYETNPEFLRKMIDSVIAQSYTNWELCIADGSKSNKVKDVVIQMIGKSSDIMLTSRIKYVKLSSNKGISSNTNAALEMASGEYVGLLDHDDYLEPNTLYEMMQVLEANLQKDGEDGRVYSNRIQAIYTDEDKVDAKGERFFDPHRKPDYDIDLLRSNNYICHFFVVRTSIAQRVGGFLDEYNGAQDHDFIFRCLENVPTSAVYHINKVLYHWRSHVSSTAENPQSKLYAYEAGKRAIEAHLKRKRIDATVMMTPHLGFFRVKYMPTDAKITQISRKRWDEMSGKDIDAMDCEYIMILADDLKALQKDYLDELAGHLARYEVGAVGGKIYDKHFRIESAGFSKDERGAYIPRYAGLNGHFSGYMHRASLQQRVDGLSLDCMMVRKAAIDTENEKTIMDNYLVVYDPYAEFRRQ